MLLRLPKPKPDAPKPLPFARVRVVATDEDGTDHWSSLAEFLAEYPPGQFRPMEG